MYLALIVSNLCANPDCSSARAAKQRSPSPDRSSTIVCHLLLFPQCSCSKRWRLLQSAEPRYGGSRAEPVFHLSHEIQPLFESRRHAVVNRTRRFCWHAATQSPVSRWVLPV